MVHLLEYSSYVRNNTIQLFNDTNSVGRKCIKRQGYFSPLLQYSHSLMQLSGGE